MAFVFAVGASDAGSDVPAAIAPAETRTQESFSHFAQDWIAEEAGALVRCETGDRFPRGLDVPASALLVAANEADLAALRDALAAADGASRSVRGSNRQELD